MYLFPNMRKISGKILLNMDVHLSSSSDGLVSSQYVEFGSKICISHNFSIGLHIKPHSRKGQKKKENLTGKKASEWANDEN